MKRDQPQHTSWLLTETEAAHLLGFSVRTLQAWRVRGGGPRFVKVSARCVRYQREDLEEWVRERVRRSTSDSGLAL
jgi:excisionase family DNA binding protein